MLQTPIPSSPIADGAGLRMEEVSKAFGDRIVVDRVSIAVKQGEVVGLVGPNGAGKSTTFNMLVGRDRPTRGRVFWEALDITELSLQRRAQLGIGYMPQESSVFKGLSVRDNILLILQETGVPPDEHEQRLQDLLAECCLQHVHKTHGRSLSGGERRRAVSCRYSFTHGHRAMLMPMLTTLTATTVQELARVLASNCAGGPPKILLLDEPFAGVDPIGVSEMQRQLQRLRDVKGMGILITDHNVTETFRICNRAYMVHQGQVMASGEPHVLYDNTNVKKYYLGDTFKPK